jgi:hypothetical protein
MNRETIEGKVVHVAWQKNPRFGPALKMLVVHDDGWKIWGTVPAKLHKEIERGCRIQFTAGIEWKEPKKFGFAIRPSDAFITQPAQLERRDHDTGRKAGRR